MDVRVPMPQGSYPSIDGRARVGHAELEGELRKINLYIKMCELANFQKEKRTLRYVRFVAQHEAESQRM